ncbi:WXG100 family type VII secretion target [Nocardia sp. NPDC058666]|uniref:WXG100 family type VII secretion target n=1 Tax=unclassified Nocardia TaxID=2637762 RepID=UPI003666DBEF
MSTPAEVLSWDVSGLQSLSDRATGIADALITVSNTMYTTITELAWQGAAMQAAETKAERERTQMRAIATAYDDLSAACGGAARSMAHPLAEIRTIFHHYVVPPVAVADDWSISGVKDWNSEAGVQLSRLAGLVSTLNTADAQWGAKVAEANAELEVMAPQSALNDATKAIEDTKKQDSRTDPDRIRTSAAAFQQMFGRAPTSPTDWKTAEALNPSSYDPKYQGVPPSIKVARIEPVPGQGVVRAAAFIPAAEVFNADMGGLNYDKGDNRDEDPNFDPEHARVTTYVDYENGLIITRQNPSVDSNGEVRVGVPEVQAQQLPNGAVMIQYDAGNPFRTTWSRPDRPHCKRRFGHFPE